MITIHGKNYVTVAERVQGLHKEFGKDIELTTEVLFQAPVVVKATLKTPRGIFTGISAANPNKSIEKMSPYEVAETSAVGRALGFAGYGAVDSIASADEMIKAGADTTTDVNAAFDTPNEGVPDLVPADLGVCRKCGAENVYNPKTGKVFCKDKCWLPK